MPINRRNLALLKTRTHLLPDRPSWEDLRSMAKQWADMLMTIALPVEDSQVHTGYAEDQASRIAFYKNTHLNARQMRYQRYNQLLEIVRQASEAIKGNQSMNAQAKDKAANYFFEIVQDATALASYDLDPLDYTPFSLSTFGDLHLKPAVSRARSEQDTFDQYQNRVAAIYSQYVPEYLARSFPPVSRDADIPQLNARTAITMAADLHTGMHILSPEQAGRAIAKIMVDAERDGRLNLPSIEGFREGTYWENLIQNKFSDPVNAPNHGRLLRFTVQDRLPTRAVIDTLLEQRNDSISLDDLRIDYMTGNPADNAALLSLGRDNLNRAVVMTNEDNRPVIIQAFGKGLPNTLRVVSPGYAEMIVDTMEAGENNPEKRLDYRMGAINSALFEMSRLTETGVDEKVLQDLEQQWSGMFDMEGKPSGGDVQRFHQKLAEATEFLVSPDLSHLSILPEDHREKLERWASLAQRCGLASNPEAELRFGLPRHVGSVPSDQQPDAEIVLSGHNEITLYQLEPTGRRSNPAVFGGSTPPQERAVEEARKRGANSIGRANRALKFGMQVAQFNEQGKLMRTGFRLSAQEREHLTVVSMQDIQQKIGQRGPQARSSVDITQIKQGLLSMIYGANTHNPEAEKNRSMVDAEHHWNTQGTIPVTDEFGDKHEVYVSPTVLANESREDIRRHLCCQIALTDMPFYEKEEVIERIRSADSDKAHERFNAILEDYDLDEGAPRVSYG